MVEATAFDWGISNREVMVSEADVSAQARLQRKSGLENQDSVFDSIRAENRGKSLVRGAGIDINGKELLPLIRFESLSADLPDLIPTHDFEDRMGALLVLQLDVDGKPRNGEDGEGEDPHPHKEESPD